MAGGEPLFPDGVWKLDKQRRDRYRMYLDFYNGKQWARPTRRDQVRRLTLNYARSIVHKVAGHVAFADLQVTPPAAEGGPSDEAQAAAEQAEQVLQDIAYANDLTRLDYESEVDCAVLGDGAFKVTWEPEQGVVISAPDVSNLFVWTDSRDRRRYWRVAECYEVDGVKSVEVWTVDSFEVWQGKDEVMSEVNPYGFIPYVVYPNEPVPKEFWGQSDLEPLMDPLKELNREITTLSLIMEMSGNPIAVLENVTEAEDVQAVPGAVWEIPEKAKAYLLDLLAGGGVKLHVDYLEALYRAIHDLGEIPRAAFAGIQRDLSGVALEIELRPLIQKVERKRIVRHWAYGRRGLMALALVDKFEGTNHAGVGLVQVASANPVLPRDDDAAAQREALLAGAALASHRQGMKRMGADDVEAEWDQLVEERRELAAVDGQKPTA